MRNLATALASYIEAELRERAEMHQAGRTQLLFVGPPTSVLAELFDQLTSNGTTDWEVSGINSQVIVLLVGAEPPQPPSATARSAHANWDYAVTVRHSEPTSVVLVSTRAWDLQPESIENASDRLGQPSARTAREFVKAQPWPFLLTRIESSRGFPTARIARTIRDLWRDSRELSQHEREELPWRAADDLLGGKGLAESVGLPNLAPGVPLLESIRKGREALRKLAKACAADGFGDVEQRLMDARQERREREERDIGSTDFLDDESAIPALFSYLRRVAGSGGAFARSPSFYFRIDPAAESTWWTPITNEVLGDLLSNSETPTPRGKLVLSVATLVQPARDEPCVVVDEAELEVLEKTKDGRQPVESASFIRRSREGNDEWSDVDGGQLVDTDLPEHSKPITYKAIVPDHADATARVIALDKFACHGHAHVVGALRNPPPARRARGMSPFEQTVVVRQAGIHRVVVLVATDVVKVALKEPDSETLQSDVRDHQAEFTVQIEQNTQKTVTLIDAGGQPIHTWELGFQVEETTRGVVHSQFEDLVLSHQEGIRTRLVLATSGQARELELQLMNADRGYRPLIGCWHPQGNTVGVANWDTCRIGEIHVPDNMDPRPPAAREEPPASYVAARHKVMDHLAGHPDQYVCEVPLVGQELEQMAREYLEAYTEWINTNPQAAAWTDSVAVYVATSSGAGLHQAVSDEPMVLLLTPLHPLRFAWHVNAQSRLKEALERRCPLSGLISPDQTPSVTALPIWFGEHADWRPFVSVTSSDKHWAVLANGSYLRQSLMEKAFAVLRRLGLTPQGVTGGMSPSQAKRALGDVSGMLSAKPTLRVGIVGNPEEEAGSVDGLLEWIDQGFRIAQPSVEEGVEAEEAEDVPIPTTSSQVSIEVYDFRQEPSHPSEVSLATLAEDVGGRLRWFDGSRSGKPVLDLVMFDQVGTTGAKLRRPEWTSNSRSVLGTGGLFRVHVREDQSAGRVIAEARIGQGRQGGGGLADALVNSIVAYEKLAELGNATHLEFSPDRQALVSWVQSARFLAATSTQMDPACFIRGSGEHGDYLWDYDLPSSTGVDSGTAGYYLIARPRSSMRDAIRRSLTAISDPPPPVDPFLTEISKRGIPVLKRLAAGGRRAKGEVGMLLAVRLLQDAFRADSTGIRLPVINGSCIHMLLAVDSYQSPLGSARGLVGGPEPAKRPDLLVFAITLADARVRVKVTPLEIKFHTTLQNYELTQAVEQANALGRLLKALWYDPPVNDVWDVCGRALLARCLDECFRIYADPQLHRLDSREWAKNHEAVLDAVLGAPTLSEVVSINGGRLLAFGPAFSTTKLVSMDGDALQESLLVDRRDSVVLVAGVGELSAAAVNGVDSLLFSIPGCDQGTVLRQLEVTTTERPSTSSSSPGTDLTEAAKPAAPETVIQAPVAQQVQPLPDEEEGTEADDVQQLPTDEIPEEPDEAEPGVAGPVPPELRARVMSAFDGFIGNDRPVRRVTRDLMAALMTEPPSLPVNYLFEGLPSVGKTEMARRVAKALGMPFVKLDGPGLTTREKLFDLVDAQLGVQQQPRQVGEDAGQPIFSYPAFVVFIDEIHLVTQKVQESLLTMLETRDRTVRLSNRVASVPHATFIFATTQDSKLDKAFKSRCKEIHLRSYSIAEVAQMVMNYVRDSGVDPGSWEPEVFPKIARLGRLIPRRAFEVAKELMDELRTTDRPELSLSEQLDVVRDVMEVDENGLGPLDIEYLEVLERAERALGEDAIATMIGTVDKEKVVEEVEPLLRRMGLISFGMRGREITSAGREYVATHRIGQ